jgi:hypothetical protein
MCTDHSTFTDEATPTERWEAVAPHYEHTPHGRPIIRAYSVRDMTRHWVIVCPFCGQFHSHGADDGPRNPHCRKHAPGLPEYYLRYSGPLPNELKPMLARWRRNRPYSFDGTPYAVDAVDPPGQVSDRRGSRLREPLKATSKAGI